MTNLQAVVFIGWTLAIGTALALVYGIYPYVYTVTRTMDTVESVFYMGFNRVLYACCIAWVIVACSAGYGGKSNVKKFKSYKIFSLRSDIV